MLLLNGDTYGVILSRFAHTFKKFYQEALPNHGGDFDF